jgi:membrane associated rhomboid family serine protease
MCLFFIPPIPIAGPKPLEVVPRVTYSFLAINTGVWAFLNLLKLGVIFLGIAPQVFIDLVSNMGYLPSSPQPWSYITYAFTQEGLLHLLGNIFFLWMFGCFLEERIGKAGFLTICFLGAVGSALGHHLYLDLRGDSEGLSSPLIGSSGIVMTILGAFLVVLPTAQHKFFVGVVSLFPMWFGLHHWKISIPSILYIPVFIIYDEVASLYSGAETNVSHAGHVAGLAIGIAAGIVYRLLPASRRHTEREVARHIEETDAIGRQHYLNFQEALRQGNYAAARVLWEKSREIGRGFEPTTEEVLELCHQMTEKGEYFFPETCYRELLRRRLSDDQAIEIGLRLARILLTFERDLEGTKSLLRTLYRRFREHPRIGEVIRLVEEVKTVEGNLFKRPR